MRVTIRTHTEAALVSESYEDPIGVMEIMMGAATTWAPYSACISLGQRPVIPPTPSRSSGTPDQSDGTWLTARKTSAPFDSLMPDLRASANNPIPGVQALDILYKSVHSFFRKCVCHIAKRKFAWRRHATPRRKFFFCDLRRRAHELFPPRQ
ncbi:hypothetical protein HPB48_022838 [Haemaphysalis longicornis]|uniref:Uncharacterized protein n=1 Tax=Haemaphysalis longicornis TaxID=44386 RepID=A0A9J6GCE7_HAELO|nr:hypothetical protein HPB48_022838 [Haemaphysalis longicornis]